MAENSRNADPLVKYEAGLCVQTAKGLFFYRSPEAGLFTAADQAVLAAQQFTAGQKSKASPLHSQPAVYGKNFLYQPYPCVRVWLEEQDGSGRCSIADYVYPEGRPRRLTKKEIDRLQPVRLSPDLEQQIRDVSAKRRKK